MGKPYVTKVKVRLVIFLFELVLARKETDIIYY